MARRGDARSIGCHPCEFIAVKEPRGGGQKIGWALLSKAENGACLSAGRDHGHSFFREDLYYRVNVITVRLPTLRERVHDTPLLVAHFIRKYVVRVAQAVRWRSGWNR